MVNIRQKGANAERDIADDLNLIYYMVRKELGIPIPGTPTVQRNQNQSAVGGQDLIGTLNLAIEVKRQEQLNINTWWKQCVASAKPLDHIPVLLFKQSRVAWRCITYASLTLNNDRKIEQIRAEITYDDFKSWFRTLVQYELERAQRRGTTGEGLF